MMDKIIIQDLKVNGILGINPDERLKTQQILVNVVMYVDITKAAETEDLGLSVNYDEVARRIYNHIEQSADFLIEKLITDVANLILREFAVEKVQLRIEKPEAVDICKSVGIEIERAKSWL